MIHTGNLDQGLRSQTGKKTNPETSRHEHRQPTTESGWRRPRRPTSQQGAVSCADVQKDLDDHQQRNPAALLHQDLRMQGAPQGQLMPQGTSQAPAGRCHRWRAQLLPSHWRLQELLRTACPR